MRGEGGINIGRERETDRERERNKGRGQHTIKSRSKDLAFSRDDDATHIGVGGDAVEADLTLTPEAFDREYTAKRVGLVCVRVVKRERERGGGEEEREKDRDKK